MLKEWKLSAAAPEAAAFAKELGVTKSLANILWNRGICTKEAAEVFLQPEKQPFYDPLLMKDMDRAVDRIIEAIDGEEKIVVYGDYDVDGMTATTLLVHNLKALGANVGFYIPHREKEGYGFNLPALQSIAEDGAKLLVSVDCGIASVDDVAAMAGRLDIIVTDHHLPGENLPPALAVVNPHREDCPYPDKDLAGVGVAFKLCQALWQEMHGQSYEQDLEIVALGTVADIVPLLGENRKIVAAGLKRMRKSSFAGMRALVDVSDIRDEELNTGHVGFRLAPRLNAAGRIGSARKGVELLLTKDEAEAESLAMELDMLNSQRQTIEQEILAKAEAELKGEDVNNLPAIVVAGENWNPGVIGIVASRLVDKYYKPTIVFSKQEDGICKGSCRSIDGLHMYEALKACKDHILQFGGHSQAAGLSVAESELQAFKEAFAATAEATLTADDYVPKVKVEMELAPEEITFELIDELAKLEPFGMKNPKPLFGVREIRGTAPQVIGKEGQHLRFQVGSTKAPVTALFWNRSDYAGIINSEAIDMVYSPAVNEWQGNRSLQCMVDSIAPADGERVFPEREQLVNIYKFLYQIQQQEDYIPYTAEELTVDFCKRGPHISLYTMSLGLRIFQELSLLRMDMDENCYYLPKASGRMDLESSPTYRRHR
ncbi:putative single-stranded-DNA-specific exonuclease [Selenomonas ruminantium subsp. lactilytica TAM6421]|uniref:Single-stranded-DNA-specific exonuclease RecJ n=1 Tax=Selenomonas ruminantium subsp. lactilytica (strain NBRC 103574 / TAM6421) TaxID=927704 RepID=I0GPG8_SELRL|nr:single-stranded-DNA-specific exonuclease RecJ [Selenomonas ruminantium]BAL82655.1 putative single-stranded-DNA-specific exonuclease [Selenomonas ruminantium subsp. lactilytica TAM6421]